jgi:RNA-binding protein NOB1
MTKRFCPVCGQPGTLLRISVTTNSKGIVRQHVNYKRPIKVRGTVYSLPAPKGGKAQHKEGSGIKKDLVFAEDEWIEKSDKEKKRGKGKDKVVDILSEEFLVDALFEQGQRSGGAHRGHGNHVQIGMGRKNPNEKRKRTGNRKR